MNQLEAALEVQQCRDMLTAFLKLGPEGEHYTAHSTRFARNNLPQHAPFSSSRSMRALKHCALTSNRLAVSFCPCGTAAADRSEAQEVLVDFHFYNYAFCKEQRFDAKKSSTYMSIMHEVITEVRLHISSDHDLHKVYFDHRAA
jgi:hypothetical protein